MKLLPTRRTLSNLLLLVAGCVVAVFLCEVLLRIEEPFVHLMRNRYDINLLYAPHPLWDHWPRPGVHFSANLLNPKRYPKPLVYRFNSYGCRDGREPQIPKPAESHRIIVMGDSFTEGLYEEDTVAAELQRRLDRTKTGDEAINCGSVSYSPLLHFLRLKHELLQLAPDTVVVNIDLTDVYDDYSRYRNLYVYSADGEPLRMIPAERIANPVAAWAVGHLDVARILYSYRGNFFRATYPLLMRAGFRKDLLGIAPSEAELFSYHSTLAPGSEAWEKGVAFCLGNVSRIIDLARAHKVRLFITTYPHKEQVKADKSGRLWNRAFEFRLQQLCLQRGVGYYSAFDGIRQAYQAGQPVFFENDMHFTPEGQRVWSGLVASFVLDQLAGQP